MSAAPSRDLAMAISFREVTVDYGGGIGVHSVSAEIERGEAVALVGPSGAGKSSLLRMIHGGLAPTAGSLLVDGKAPTQLGPQALRHLRTRIGIVRQDLGLVPNMRVSRNVIAGSLGRRSRVDAWRSMLWPSSAELQTVHALLERLGIGEKLYHRVDQLSGGEQQRVAIARALYQEPRLILADEPLSALDPSRSREVLELFLGVAAERGVTLLLSLHDVALARECVPRLIGLRDGQLQFDGAASELQDHDFEGLYRISGTGA